MARKRRGVKIDGWLAIDKPLNMTSTQVVGAVKRITNAQKIGHGGTLDPLASGILPIALGEATKTVSYVMDGEKIYHFSIRFGQSTTTDDAEGEILEKSDFKPDEESIRLVLSEFVGKINQIPPKYSAIKINGKRAYDLARSGEEVEIKSREVKIHSLELLSYDSQDISTFSVRCGKGTYVRSLARDIAEKLNTKGHVVYLRRIKCGPFDEKNAISLEKLETIGHSPLLVDSMLCVTTALADIPAQAVSEVNAKKIRNGMALDLDQNHTFEQGITIRVMFGDILLALAKIDENKIKPLRVFNLNTQDKE